MSDQSRFRQYGSNGCACVRCELLCNDFGGRAAGNDDQKILTLEGFVWEYTPRLQ